MAFPPSELSDEAIEFLTVPRTIAALATTRRDGVPHVASVGYTFVPELSLVSIVTMPSSQKVRNIEAGSAAVLNQVTGMMWLQVAGPARVLYDELSLHVAYERFAARYGRVHEGDDLCVVEIAVERCLGPHNGWGRVGFEHPGHPSRG